MSAVARKRRPRTSKPKQEVKLQEVPKLDAPKHVSPFDTPVKGQCGECMGPYYYKPDTSDPERCFGCCIRKLEELQEQLTETSDNFEEAEKNLTEISELAFELRNRLEDIRSKVGDLKMMPGQEPSQTAIVALIQQVEIDLCQAES